MNHFETGHFGADQCGASLSRRSLPKTSATPIAPKRRIVRSTLLATALLLGPQVSIAFAHVEPNPKAVAPGEKRAVAFGVEHGCKESPTTKLSIKLPPGVTADAPTGPKGFTGSVTNGVVMFEGGSLAKSGAFNVTLTFPQTEGVLSFPTVQTCAVGSTSWIAVATKSNPNPKLPAPQIAVIATAGSTKTSAKPTTTKLTTTKPTTAKPAVKK
jgi:periplasmic copper chaperone A